MPYVLKNNIHGCITKTVYDEIITGRDTYYYFLGKVLPWGDENNPDTPIDTLEYESKLRNNIIGIKKITSNDVSYVIRRIDWITGTVYDQYDPNYDETFTASSGATSLKDSNFYVLTVDSDIYCVYKCISNNNGAQSTSKPVGNDLIPIKYPDGYVWKFMYTIPLANRNKFLNDDWMPVSKAILNSFYSDGEISSVIIDNGGFGYTSNLQTTLTVNGDFVGNTSIANIRPVINDAGQFIDVLIDDQGNNYANVDIVINDTLGNGESYFKWVSSVDIDNVGLAYIANAVANTTISIITTGAFQPTANATFTPIFINNVLSKVNIINRGSGYDANVIPNTTISVTTTGDTQPTTNANVIVSFQETALLTPVLVGGKLVDVIIEDTGINYGSNLETYITITGDGTGANLIPIVGETSEIENIIIDKRGNGYTYLNINILGNGSNANAYAEFFSSDLNTSQELVELSAVKGGIHNFRINSGGNNYTVANITINGNGSDFVANTILVDNVINNIEVFNAGKNYTIANVIIDGDGTGANIEPIYSPVNGHGFDAIKELFGSALMFYSTIILDKNKNITLDNDYRQFGIIKGVKKFSNNCYFSNISGSSCYLLTMNNVVGLDNDSVMTLSTDNVFSEFTVIEVDADNDKILVTNKNNRTIKVTDVLIDNSSNVNYTIIEIENPDINKFSGEIIYIDNREKVLYNENQIVTLKTVLKI